MVFRQYATELHIELHLICRIACALCHAMPSLNRTCIILGCASCHVYVVVVYYVVCFFPVLLLRVGSVNVAFVRTRSTTSVCLLHGLVSSSLRDFRQDDHTLEITSIFAMLVCLLFCHANATMPTICLSASQIAMSNL